MTREPIDSVNSSLDQSAAFDALARSITCRRAIRINRPPKEALRGFTDHSLALGIPFSISKEQNLSPLRCSSMFLLLFQVLKEGNGLHFTVGLLPSLLRRRPLLLLFSRLGVDEEEEEWDVKRGKETNLAGSSGYILVITLMASGGTRETAKELTFPLAFVFTR